MKDIIKKAEEIANIMKSFSNKDKLTILCFLGDETKNVSTIMESSTLSQSQISQYLGRMKLEKILDSKKEGKEVFYHISDKKVLELIKAMKKIFNN